MKRTTKPKPKNFPKKNLLEYKKNDPLWKKTLQKKTDLITLLNYTVDLNSRLKTHFDYYDLYIQSIDFKFILSSFENLKYPKQSKKLRKVKYFKYLNFPVNPIN